MLLLIAILALAAFLRLDGLGEVDLRGDEVTFFLTLQEGINPVSYLVDHLRQFDHDRQMPIPRWLSATLVQALGLPADTRSARLFFALAGMATSLAFWVLGSQLGCLFAENHRRQPSGAGEQEAWWVVSLAPLLALLTAINPFHLYWSRTAHIYVYPLLFLTLSLACALGWLRSLAHDREREGAARAWLVGTGVSTILASYSHMSAWPACGLLWLFLLGAWLSRRGLARTSHQPSTATPNLPRPPASDGDSASRQSVTMPAAQKTPSSLDSQASSVSRDEFGEKLELLRAVWPLPFWPRALLAVLGFWALSLAPWAWQFAEGITGGTADPVWSGATNPLYEFGAMWRLPFVMTWGGGWRSAFTVGLPLAALILGWRHRSWGRTIRWILGAGLILFVVLSLAQSTGFFAVRYYAPLWTLLLLLSGLGVVLLAEKVGSKGAGRASVVLRSSLALTGFTVALAAAMFIPLRALLELRGNPVEFSRLARTLDETFSEATPVLINGMNVAMVEMKPYLSEKVTATFTIPDIGFEMWRDNQWRASAEGFLRRFPDAALVQQGRNFYDHPEVGPWAFPEEYFAQQIQLRNEPALTLRRLLLAASEDFSSGSVESSRSIVRVLYNWPEDLVARARSEGKEELVLFGEGWHYLKLRDFSDWRGVSERASLVLHNLSETTRRLEVEILYRLQGGRKQLRVVASDSGEVIGDYVANPVKQVAVWPLVVEVQPGSRELDIVDPTWQTGRATLLVAAVRIKQEEPSDLSVVSN